MWFSFVLRFSTEIVNELFVTGELVCRVEASQMHLY